MRKWIVIFSLLMVSCNGPKVYQFNYEINVSYEDGEKKTLSSSTIIETKYPHKIKLSLSSRLRMKACIIIGEIGTISSTNISCGVRDFEVISLTYKRVRNEE